MSAFRISSIMLNRMEKLASNIFNYFVYEALLGLIPVQRL